MKTLRTWPYPQLRNIWKQHYTIVFLLLLRWSNLLYINETSWQIIFIVSYHIYCMFRAAILSIQASYCEPYNQKMWHTAWTCPYVSDQRIGCRFPIGLHQQCPYNRTITCCCCCCCCCNCSWKPEQLLFLTLCVGLFGGLFQGYGCITAVSSSASAHVVSSFCLFVFHRCSQWGIVRRASRAPTCMLTWCNNHAPVSLKHCLSTRPILREAYNAIAQWSSE